jgi:hypothetical protein
MRCAKQTRKQIFIMLTCANMNMKKHDKEMMSPIFIYTPLGT